MRIRNLASGSSGNSTYIGAGNTHILIDSGISRKKIVQGLDGAGISLKDLSAIFITHEHIDHIGSLGVMARTLGIPIYATQGTINGINNTSSLGQFDRELLTVVRADEPVMLGDISICPIRISHDAAEPVCYKVNEGNKSFAVVTDLGIYDDYLLERLRGLDGILLEANHDVRMLEVGPYPYQLKRRILGEKGHLSNETSGRLLSQLLHDDIRYICLGHLSHENNTRELAKLAVEMEIKAADNKYMPGDFEINVAHREEASQLALL